ncbi:MAG TPA: TetR family transcriptional regulator [Candidatus Limnocylindrales bacterium]|jgi:AcrR family transcriptional regulator
MPARRRTIRGSARNAILGATLEIIASHGIDAVTHRRVAERAGVSPGSTTHHFSSREDLLREAFRFYLKTGDRLLAAIDEETRASVSDPEERVRRFATEIIRREFIEPGARFIRAEHEMLLFASADSQLASYVRAWEARWVASIAGDLEAAGWPQPVEAARTLMNLIRGYELERLLNPDSDAAEFRRRLDSVLTRTDRR